MGKQNKCPFAHNYKVNPFLFDQKILCFVPDLCISYLISFQNFDLFLYTILNNYTTLT